VSARLQESSAPVSNGARGAPGDGTSCSLGALLATYMNMTGTSVGTRGPLELARKDGRVSTARQA
jgi:hypothetical protein